MARCRIIVEEDGAELVLELRDINIDIDRKAFLFEFVTLTGFAVPSESFVSVKSSSESAPRDEDRRFLAGKNLSRLVAPDFERRRHDT